MEKKGFNKKIISFLGIFILVFIISLVFGYIFNYVNFDEVWIYGFSRNISKGMVIYRDFNVVTTPLYYFIVSVLIKIFGNYMIVMGAFNAFIVSTIIMMLFKIIKWKVFIIFPLILIYPANGYNLFSLFFLILILYLLNNKKNNDILIAYIIGLLFITKQSIGLYLLIPYLFYSKNKFKGIIYFLIPITIISIYLIYNNAFYKFIDYCFLGMFDFGTNNSYFSVFTILEIFVVIYLIIKLIKSKFKDSEVFYILMFQLIMYPLPDEFHFFSAVFPVAYYILKNEKSNLLRWQLFFGIYYFVICVFINMKIMIHFEKDLFFMRNSGILDKLMDYYQEYLKDFDNYYFTGHYSYMYKLYHDIPIGEFDLWNEGNYGYNGIEKKIKELDEKCKNEECIFIVNKDYGLSKTSQLYKICNYVLENYYYIDEIPEGYVYSNRVGIKTTIE